MAKAFGSQPCGEKASGIFWAIYFMLERLKSIDESYYRYLESNAKVFTVKSFPDIVLQKEIVFY